MSEKGEQPHPSYLGDHKSIEIERERRKEGKRAPHLEIPQYAQLHSHTGGPKSCFARLEKEN